LEQASTTTISKQQKEDRKASVDWAILNMLLFVSVLINFVYSTYLAQAFLFLGTHMVSFADMSGMVDIHVVRFFYQIIFDLTDRDTTDVLRKQEISFPDGAKQDTLIVVAIIVPAFILALHFLVAPITQRYKSRIIYMTAPLMMPILFVCYSWDVTILAVHVATLHLYATYFISS